MSSCACSNPVSSPVPVEAPSLPGLPIAIDRDGGAASVGRTLRAMASRPGVGSLLVLLTPHIIEERAEFEPLVRALPVPVVGAVFPRLILGPELFNQGAIVIGLPGAMHPTVIGPLRDRATDPVAAVRQLPALPVDSLLLALVDGWSPHVRALAHTIFEEFGSSVRVVGGGAGTLERPGAPCLLTNDGLTNDCAVLLPIPWPAGVGVGVGHGWYPISPSLKVTAADGTTIRELDHEPASTVLERILSTRRITRRPDDDLLTLASRHPLGLKRLGSELVLRDPVRLSHDGRGLVFLCDVPVGSFVHIMQADRVGLLRAGERAVRRADVALRSRPAALRLVFDCISREALMGARIREDLGAFSDGVPTVGAFTIGEIAADGEDYLEYHNKTIVISHLARLPK
jgi:hypothetical protein